MGEVYAAEDERLRREVAIKFISRENATDRHAQRRFELEARAASALNHPTSAPSSKSMTTKTRHSSSWSCLTGTT